MYKKVSIIGGGGVDPRFPMSHILKNHTEYEEYYL